MTRGLEFDETAGIDPERLAQLYAELGEREADRVICDAMEDLALSLARIGRAYAARDRDRIVALAAGLERVCARIGLGKLERVAQGVRICAARGDVPGLDATLARLSRVGDRSLSAVWDPHYHRI